MRGMDRARYGGLKWRFVVVEKVEGCGRRDRGKRVVRWWMGGLNIECTSK